MRNTFMVKRQDSHRPSMSMGDIRLADRQYLVQGPIMADTEAETKEGIWIPITKEMKMLNAAKVLKAGPGCSLANVGEYVVFSSITGENFNHLKPQPVYRDYFDEEGLYTLDEAHVRAVIPEAVRMEPGVLLEDCNGKDLCCSERGPKPPPD